MIGLALPPPGARAFYDRQRDTAQAIPTTTKSISSLDPFQSWDVSSVVAD